MNNSYGSTDLASPEPSDVNHLLEIDEADIRLLAPYEGENDGRTLVGLGPVSRQAAAEEHENAARSLEPAALSLQPPSQPPGPWASVDEAPVSVRGKKLGIWGVAVPLLLVVAALAVVFVRALAAPAAPRSAAVESVAAPVERNDAALGVRLSGADVRVFLDGQDRGRPPLLLSGLAPGSHSVAIIGPSYAPFEQPVTLVNDHESTLEPKLVLVRGSLNLTAGADADGARVEVVGGGERRELTTLPLKLEMAPGEYQIRAKKLGFPPFETNVTLSAATPEVAVVIDLGKTPRGGTLHAANPGASDDGSATTNDELSGTGSLNITSSPPSSVVLDGRPLGKAPRVVDVPAGTHTVVFIHPKYGRQSVTVNALAGQTTSASADF